MAIAPANLTAVAMALLGTGLLVSAFVGESLGLMRLLGGIALVVAALITTGLQLLNRNAGSMTMKEGV
jgi:hypothetical protein